MRVPRVATLVLLDRRPLQFPPFCEGNVVGEACSLFEASSPCEPVATVDIYSFLSCCSLPFFLVAPSFTEKRWDCCGLVFRKDETQSELPGWPPSSFSIVVPFNSPLLPKARGLGGLCFVCALFSTLFSSFRSLALRRKGGIVVGWCRGRAKSSASSRGGHPSPSRSLSHTFPPFLRGRGAGGRLSSVRASPREGVRHLCFSFSPAFFLLLPLGLTFVVGGCPPYSVLWPIFR